ncbi:GyrI-like domain-containing protein [Rossellomorea aquimaris]|uniref:GyrI-like domain-containing protein n=1 Tax=Rossellomorea aquimaris TaxID=189382 RepID=UPI0007D09037|nr:GyrI-like domain-containing protein [Rossellomorea aquimaris]
MERTIVELEEKKLIGKSMSMSLEMDTTRELWRGFMPHRTSIPYSLDEKLYNVKVFESGFDPTLYSTSTIFRKWAAVEVESFDNGMEEMQQLTMSGGLYAMFLHHGPASRFNETLGYIYESWLPTSGYGLDEREHFERFTEEYNPTDLEAVEEVWIPIKKLDKKKNA